MITEFTGLELIDDPVVKSALTPLPEFETGRFKSEPSPEEWTGDVALIELRFNFSQLRFERLSIRDLFTLRRGPGADLTAARTAGKILL